MRFKKRIDISPIKPVNGRSCGTCTKCCDGHLMAKIGNHTMGLPTDDPYNPTPCLFVRQGKGCGIYKTRPIDPCKTYTCDWLINADIPDEFKPDISQVIASRKITSNGHEYLEIVEAGQKMDPKILSWFFLYAMNKQLNFLWILKDGGPKFMGTQEFCKELDYAYTHNQKV